MVFVLEYVSFLLVGKILVWEKYYYEKFFIKGIGIVCLEGEEWIKIREYCFL